LRGLTHGHTCVRESEREGGVCTIRRCSVCELIMQYDAIAAELTRLDYRWLLRVRALFTARRRRVLKGGMAAAWPAAHQS